MSRTRTAVGPALTVLLGALSLFGPLSVDTYLPAFPDMRDDLMTSASQVQLTLTGCLVGIAVGQLVLGALSDTYGRRRPLLIGLAVFVAASLACAVAPNVPLLVVARIVQGLAGAAGVVLSRTIVRDLHSGVGAARLFANLMLVNALGPILAPILGAQVLRLTSWRGVFVLLAVLGAILFLAAAAMLHETLPPEARRRGGLRETLAAFGVLLGDRGFVGCLLAAGMTLSAMFVYISSSSFVLQDLHGVSPTTYSIIFACGGLGLMVTGRLSNRLVERVGSLRLLGLGVGQVVVGGIVLTLSATLGGGLATLLPGLFLTTSSVGWVVPNATALALEDHADNAGAASGLLGLATFAFGAVVAPLAGVAGEDTAVPMALLILGAGLSGCTAYVALVRPAHTRATALG